MAPEQVDSTSPKSHLPPVGDVLYFEDEEKISKWVVSKFSENNVNVRFFDRPESAKLACAQPHLAAALIDILDAQSRDSGLEVANAFRRAHPFGYLEIVTAHDEERYRKRAAEIGVDEFTPKPVKPRELLDHVIAGVRRSRLKEAIAQYRETESDLTADLAKLAPRLGIYPLAPERSLDRLESEVSAFCRLLGDLDAGETELDPFVFARIEDAAQTLFETATKSTSTIHQDLSVLLLKSVRILPDLRLDAVKVHAMLAAANLLKAHTIDRDTLLEVDRNLVAAGIDTVVDIEGDALV
jgi:DNA-binding response OmpR family regulator